MRLVDVLLFCMVIVLADGCIVSALPPMIKVYRKTTCLEKEYGQDKCISEQFKKIATQTNEVLWLQEKELFVKQNKALWPLQSLEVEQRGRIIRAEWKYGDKVVDQFVERKSGGD